MYINKKVRISFALMIAIERLNVLSRQSKREEPEKTMD